MANALPQKQVLAVCQAIEALRGLTRINALWNLTEEEASKGFNALLSIGTLRGTDAKDLLTRAGWTLADGWAINLMKYPKHQIQPVYIDRPSLETFVKDFAAAWEAYLTDGVEQVPEVESAPTEVPAAKPTAAQDFDAALAEAVEFIEARGRNFQAKALEPAPKAPQTLVYQRRLASAWDDVRVAINATPLTCADAAASVWVNRAVIEEIMEVLREEGYRVQNLGPDTVDKGARLLTISW